jgi:hypothetical protein
VQSSVSSQRPSSLGSPAPRHVVGMQLLAGGGEDAVADAAQVEGGPPVESFDAFCLAQRAGELHHFLAQQRILRMRTAHQAR